MNDLVLERLKTGTAGRYGIVRELGRGGMARVFLASDLRHPRQVALKVLHPELAAAMGPERFEREIGMTASLSHPHILPLLESGQAEGLLYYVMPYVDGETLRARLDREHMLPIPDVIDIARQVGDALAYAHTRGIIHRDVKPENILLTGTQAVIADFGIAHAVSESARLTETGLAVGTAAYMSPEQSLAIRDLDGRSDQYSLACVIYEMLVGEAPFTGRNARAIAARHTLDPVPPIRTIRETVPPAMERAVLRALGKLPVDRYQTVSAFVEALTGALAEPVALPLSPRLARRRVAPWALGVLTGLLVIVTAVLGWRALRTARQVAGSDPNLLAIAPFSVSGPVDTTLLSADAIAELLRAKLAGSSGYRIADPRAVTAEWRKAGATASASPGDRDVGRIGAELRAGRVLVGQVAGTSTELILSARLLEGGSGNELVRVDGIRGPRDSVLSLLDQLVARLLLRNAGEEGNRLNDLASENLEALRAYLAGTASYRRGEYEGARQHLQRAIEIDTGFALAALELASATALTERSDLGGDAISVAWAHRDRLSPPDVLYLQAMAGARYPELSTTLEDIRLWEHVADTLPDRWEASYEMGDMLFHYGPAVGRESAHQMAGNAFRRALARDSSFAPALEHLIDLAAITEDTVDMRRLAQRYFAVAPGGDHAEYVRWRVGTALGDRRMADSVIGRLSALPPDILERIAGVAQLDGVALDDAARAIAEQRTRAHTQIELWLAIWAQRELDFNRGRPSEAPPPPGPTLSVPLDELELVIQSIYWDGDSTIASQAVGRRRANSERALPPGDAAVAAYMDNCTIGLWEGALGNWAGAARAASRLATARDAETRTATTWIPICRAMLEAEVAAGHKAPDASTKLAVLDSLLRQDPVANPYVLFAGNATAARLFELEGNLPAALAAARRRPYVYGSFGVAGLSTLLREEGRLAARTGDRTGAIRAYQHYLRLRRSPEPRLATQVEEVRRALASLSPDQPR